MFEGAEHDVRDFLAGVRPDVDDLVVTLAVGDDAVAILFLDDGDFLVSALELDVLLLRNDHVDDADGNARLHRPEEAELLELVEGIHGRLMTRSLISAEDHVGDLLLAASLVEEAHALRPDLVEDDAARGGLDDVLRRFAEDGVFAEVRVLVANPVVDLDAALSHRELDLARFGEERQAVRFFRAGELARILRKVVTTENDVLRRRGDWLATRGREEIVRREHEHARFHLRLDAERDVDGHLVSVEVRVVSGADERMNADRFALDELRLECLDR